MDRNARFTRTFMELKQTFSSVKSGGVLSGYSFTRTFMELKHWQAKDTMSDQALFYSYLYGIETIIFGYN
jgi:hypothetical protein